MATQRLAPDAILEQTNLSGALSAIQDDPDAPDGNWLTATSMTSNITLRVSFPTPNPVLNTGSVQGIRVLVRKSVGQNGTPTASVDLMENGNLVSTIVGSTNVTGSIVLAGSFDKASLADPTGANVEIRVNGVSVGGNPSTRATVEVGAVEWNTAYTAVNLVSRTAADTVTSITDAIARVLAKTRTASDNIAGTPAVTTYAAQNFNTDITLAWENADPGGPWTMVGSAVAQSGGVGQMTPPAGGTQRGDLLDVSQLDTEAIVKTSFDQVVNTSSGVNIYLESRYTGSSTHYRARLQFTSSNQVKLQLELAGTAVTNGAFITIARETFVPGVWYWFKFQTLGSDPAVLRAKVWRDGTTEPSSWDIEGTDFDAGLNNTAGAPGIRAFTGSNQLPFGTYSFDDFSVTSIPTGGGGGGGVTDSVVATISQIPLLIRSAVDTITTSDAVARVAGKIRSLADTVVIGSDNVVRVLVKPRVFVDSVSIGADTFVRAAFVRIRTLSDTRSTTDSLVRAAATRLRTFTDTSTVSDALVRIKSMTRTLAETLVTSDAVTRTANKVRATADNVLGITDALVRSAANKTRALTDTTILTDVVAAGKFFGRTLVDTIATSDAFTRTINRFRSFTDTTAVSDALARAVVSLRTFVDATVTGDTVVTSFKRVRTLVDTLSVSESLSRALSAIRSVSDTTLLSDSLLRAGLVLHRITFDTLGAITDTLARSFAVLRTITDSVTTSDSVVAQIFVGAIQLFRSATDTVATSDAVGRILSLTRFSTDTTSVADTFNRFLSFIRTTADNVITSDVVTRFSDKVRVTLDITSVTDNVHKAGLMIRSAADAITSASDVVIRASTKVRTLTDAISVNDFIARQWQGVRSVVDALPSITETLSTNLHVIIVRALSDTVNIGSDALHRTTQAFRVVADTTLVSDSTAYVRSLVRRMTDTVFSTDVLVRGGIVIKRAANDIIIGIVDSVSALHGLPAYVGESVHAAINHAIFRILRGDASSNVGGGANRLNVGGNKRKTKVK